MSGKSINFDNKKINKSSFYKNKKLFSLHDTDVNKILVLKSNHMVQKIRLNTSLDITMVMLLDHYVYYFLNNNKTMSFKVSDNKLLKKYKKIWEKVGNLLSIEFDIEPVYSDEDKYIKTRRKVYGDKVNTNFQGKKVSNENV